MDRIHFPLRLTLLLAVGAMMLGGCETDRLRAERNALFQQNQELQATANRASAERDAALAKQNALNQETARLQAALDAERNKPAIATNAPVATGFDRIPGIETEKTPDRITVRVPGDVLFAPGQVVLKSTSKKTLDQIAAVIRRDYASNLIRIEGYTDTDPIRFSKWKDNLELSLHRAASVHRYLQSRGIDGKKMYAAGFGPHKPRRTKALSRRVEIVVVLKDSLAAGR